MYKSNLSSWIENKNDFWKGVFFIYTRRFLKLVSIILVTAIACDGDNLYSYRSAIVSIATSTFTIDSSISDRVIAWIFIDVHLQLSHKECYTRLSLSRSVVKRERDTFLSLSLSNLLSDPSALDNKHLGTRSRARSLPDSWQRTTSGAYLVKICKPNVHPWTKPGLTTKF